jgi:hypothetical protein
MTNQNKKPKHKYEQDVYGKPLHCSIYVDGYLKSTLDDLHTLRTKNFDGVGLVTGEEGAGKTTLAMQMAVYLDAGFSNKNIVFNADQFERAVEDLPKGSVIMWDEADDMGAGWSSEIMLALKKTFKRIRKRNFIILLVTPTFHDANKYFAVHRSRFLIDVRANFVERGFYYLFGREAKKMLYLRGKKEMNMKAWKPNYWGSFTNYPPNFPVDLEAYEEAKDYATSLAIQKVESKKDIKVDIYSNLVAWLDTNKVAYKRDDLALILGVNPRTVSRYKVQSEMTI